MILTSRKQNFRLRNCQQNIWIFRWENLDIFLRIFDFIYQVILTNKILRFSCFFWIFHENFSKKFHQKNLHTRKSIRNPTMLPQPCLKNKPPKDDFSNLFLAIIRTSSMKWCLVPSKWSKKKNKLFFERNKPQILKKCAMSFSD